MSENRSLTAVYTPRESGDGESFWIRLEQEKPEDETLTVAEAAEIIDSLFGIEPCDDGMGGGGEEASEENYPPEEELDAKMAEMLNRAGLCHEAEYWEAVVNVYRSHKQPDYELRSETAEVETVEPVRESRRQDVEANGAVIELDMPYAGGLTGIPAGVGWEVRGSTVNLDRPVNGRLVLRYNTYYERVTLRVPTTAAPSAVPGAVAVAVSGGAAGKKPRPTLDSAAVVAFWGELAASCDLEPPDQDEDADQAEIDRICRQGGDSSVHGDSSRDCWAEITHYDRCNCSRSRVNEWTEVVAVACDEPVEREVFGSYVYCEDGGDPELQDPEFYKKRCCSEPPIYTSRLPRCRRVYERWRGGEAIEGGAEHWKNLYGPNVALVAVMPENGDCGEKITEWNVPQRNCCDGVPPLERRADSPTSVWAPGSVRVRVDGGRAPYKWTVRTHGWRFGGPGGPQTVETTERGVTVYADEDSCNDADVIVDDGCSRLVMHMQRENTAETDPLVLSEIDLAVGGDFRFQLSASGGARPYMWMATGGIILEYHQPDGSSAMFRTGPVDEWCMGVITVADQCGQDAICTVRNSQRGNWKHLQASEYDRCSPPGGVGMPMITPTALNLYTPVSWTYPDADGWSIQASTNNWNWREAALPCGIGSMLSPREDLWAQHCAERNPGGQHPTYESVGKCGSYYLSDYAQAVRRWICGE